MKIVVMDGYSTNPGDLSWDWLDEYGEVTVYEHPALQPAEVIARIGDAEVVFQNKIAMTREVIEACPNLKFIGELATGYNNVDLVAAREKGIVVSNVPAYSTMSVAQLTFALLLEITHRVGLHDQCVHAGEWIRSLDQSFCKCSLIELDGKTMGIIGFGRIGQAVGRIAKTFGMNVIAYSRSEREEGKAIAEYVSLEELLRRSDVISLHCPMSKETGGIINRGTIAQMKDGVILINTSRGQLVVEQDLADALNFGKVYAAGLDVVSTEPMKADNPLLGAKNCFITPHIGWMPFEARCRMMKISKDNLQHFLAGNPINNVAK